MPTNLVESVLTCVSLQQAQAIIDRLLDKQLISRAEVVPMHVENEVKVILENLENDLEKIKQEIYGLFGKEGQLQDI